MNKTVSAVAIAIMASGLLALAGQAQTADDSAAATQQPAAQEEAAAPTEQPIQVAFRWRRHKSEHKSEKSSLWNDVPTGFALAKKENKPIITDFYTDWCGWCKVMEKKTFEDPQVEKLMSENFVLVRANAEDHGSGQRLSQENQINGYPTIIIFDPSGQAKATMVGYQKVDAFMEKLNAFLAGKPIPADE